jgi:hypothetical protein
LSYDEGPLVSSSPPPSLRSLVSGIGRMLTSLERELEVRQDTESFLKTAVAASVEWTQRSCLAGKDFFGWRRLPIRCSTDEILDIPRIL